MGVGSKRHRAVVPERWPPHRWEAWYAAPPCGVGRLCRAGAADGRRRSRQAAVRSCPARQVAGCWRAVRSYAKSACAMSPG
jgi:hypothetical protein